MQAKGFSILCNLLRGSADLSRSTHEWYRGMYRPHKGGMMKKLYVIALALLLVGSAVVVFAAPPDPGSGSPGSGAPHQWTHPHHQFGSFLNLSKEQMEKMRQIRNSFFADTHDLRYDIREKRVEMRKLFTDPKATDAARMSG